MSVKIDIHITDATPEEAQRVRHNGLKASPLFGKEGTIRKIGDDGQVFVEFGESTTWLMPHSIAVIQEASS